MAKNISLLRPGNRAAIKSLVCVGCRINIRSFRDAEGCKIIECVILESNIFDIPH